MGEDETFLFLAPEVDRFLFENELDTRQLLKRSGRSIEVDLKHNPAADSTGQKEPTTVLLASAAVIAALTPALRELIRTLSGRDVVVRERRLVPIEDSHGKVVRDASGAPVLHWVDVVKGQSPDLAAQPIAIKGYGIAISFGGKR